MIETYRARAKAQLPLPPHGGVPEEMGTRIATLALGRLPNTTGQVISADGGRLVERF